MKGKLYFILSMIIFGAVGIFAKYIEMPSYKIAFSLSLIGALFSLAVFKFRKQKIAWMMIKKNVIPLFVASIALSGNWFFLFAAYKETTIANAALSYYFAPVLVIMLSPLILNERLSIKKGICIVISLVGLFLILKNSTQQMAGNNLLGIGFGLIAAIFYATLTITNKFIRDLDGFTITFVQLSLSVLLFLPFMLFTSTLHFAITKDTLLLIILLGVLHGGIGFYLFFTGMKMLKTQSIAILSYIDPLTSLLISILIVKEKMTLEQLVGAVLLLGSIWVAETQWRRVEKRQYGIEKIKN